ncbi:MAG: hypothetical protein IPK07_24235 [Deltaproteobacteria bacterium]|nr:hypothetical protein [Deltaproteobacteria bacterium]
MGAFSFPHPGTAIDATTAMPTNQPHRFDMTVPPFGSGNCLAADGTMHRGPRELDERLERNHIKIRASATVGRERPPGGAAYVIILTHPALKRAPIA